jgi:hypothetical protein
MYLPSLRLPTNRTEHRFVASVVACIRGENAPSLSRHSYHLLWNLLRLLQSGGAKVECGSASEGPEPHLTK